MSSDWVPRTVESLCSRVGSGGTPKRTVREYYSPASIPWIKSGDLKDALIESWDESISDSGLANSAAKVWPTGTVLMAMYGLGTAGRLGIVGEPAACNQAICAMVANPEVCDARWLFYMLKSDRDRIEQSTNGAVQQNISATAIRQYTYLAPPLPEQQAIAEVLGALDDKIAANTALVRTAWELAETEFRSIQADPARSRTTLGAIAALEYGKALPATARLPGKVSVVGSGGVSGSHSAALVNHSGVVVGRKGSAGSVHWVSGPHFPIDTTFYVRGIRQGISQPYLFFLLRALRLGDMNNDSAVPGLNRAEALALPVVVASSAVIDVFTMRAGALIEVVEAVGVENRTLAATRDALLPQLMSGGLRVRDAESIASNAGA